MSNKLNTCKCICTGGRWVAHRRFKRPSNHIGISHQGFFKACSPALPGDRRWHGRLPGELHACSICNFLWRSTYEALSAPESLALWQWTHRCCADCWPSSDFDSEQMSYLYLVKKWLSLYFFIHAPTVARPRNAFQRHPTGAFVTCRARTAWWWIATFFKRRYWIHQLLRRKGCTVLPLFPFCINLRITKVAPGGLNELAASMLFDNLPVTASRSKRVTVWVSKVPPMTL